ncbi:MAG: sigma 54-interacting transcriptional regulator [Deltaproteobacteria bacterium]|jgi:transcriptional regulator with PAS, ATPase and Fis domain
MSLVAPSVCVDFEGPLGCAIAAVLQRSAPSWRIAAKEEADLVVVDGDEPQPTPSRVLIIGRDLTIPFSTAELRSVAGARLARRRDPIVAVDPPMREALRVAERIAPRPGSVLIAGPTGVGKELLAKRLHDRSRRTGKFIAVNGAAISPHLAESLLFGHRRGAFTGADQDTLGAFREAAGGTLFLDEVGELEPAMQAKLLRVLETGQVQPVGAATPTPVDVRVVSATNRNLLEESATQRFRADLYYRLSTFRLDVPALGCRPNDLAELIDRFIAAHDRAGEVSLAPCARAALCEHDWPGNVRELKNIVDRVMSISAGPVLTATQLCALAPELRSAADTPTTAPRTSAPLDALERSAVERALAVHGSVKRAAEALGIHRTTLWRMRQRWQTLDAQRALSGSNGVARAVECV